MKGITKQRGTGGRLRWALLAASVAAFFLVPTAAANAAIDTKLTIEGSGEGVVTGEAPFTGNPPINCHKPSQGGDVCETESTKPEEAPFKAVVFLEEAAAGSKFVEWKVVKGFVPEGCGTTSRCPVANTGTGIEVKAIFEKTAEPNVHILIEGTGSGSVVANPESNLGGTPPVDCDWNGATEEKTGDCDVMAGKAESFEGINVIHEAAPGSEFAGWEVVEGFGVNCEPMAKLCAAVFPPITIKATFTLEAPAGPELTVVKEGTGSGTVVSNPAGIECGATCKASFETNQKVTLTASPSAGSLFLSWKGCEVGGVNGRQCTVTMDKAKTVVAKFIKAYDVTVNRVGTGLGKVGSSPGGVLCLSNCSSTTAAFKEGTSVTLTAVPTKNYVFTEWTGDCSGSGTCSLPSLSANKTVGAKFTALPQHLLTVTKSGGGQGTAKSNLAGINCGATCSSMAAAYVQGQEVELTATSGKGSSFGGWSGACTGTGTCKVTMSAAKNVTAEFK